MLLLQNPERDELGKREEKHKVIMVEGEEKKKTRENTWMHFLGELSMDYKGLHGKSKEMPEP